MKDSYQDMMITFSFINLDSEEEITHKFALEDFDELEHVVNHIWDFLMGMGYFPEAILKEFEKFVDWKEREKRDLETEGGGPSI